MGFFRCDTFWDVFFKWMFWSRHWCRSFRPKSRTLNLTSISQELQDCSTSKMGPRRWVTGETVFHTEDLASPALHRSVGSIKCVFEMISKKVHWSWKEMDGELWKHFKNVQSILIYIISLTGETLWNTGVLTVSFKNCEFHSEKHRTLFDALRILTDDIICKVDPRVFVVEANKILSKWKTFVNQPSNKFLNITLHCITWYIDLKIGCIEYTNSGWISYIFLHIRFIYVQFISVQPLSFPCRLPLNQSQPLAVHRVHRRCCVVGQQNLKIGTRFSNDMKIHNVTKEMWLK